MDYPRGLCVHQLFEAQVLRTPETLAGVYDSRRFTYLELNRRADQLAAHLQTLGVGPDVLVGLCAERSIETVVGLLAVLKAGGAYVPLDPAYPAERLAFMIEDAQVAAVLTQTKLLSNLPPTRAQKICLDTWNWSARQVATHNAPIGGRPVPTPDSLAYVIYTSGSTGRPKGVAMVHHALVNLLSWHERVLPLALGERTLQFTSLSFDVSFQEHFSTWCGGGTLVLMSEELRRDPVGLWRYLREQQISRLFLPFVALQQLAEAASDSPEVPTTLREVITAGEQLRITPKIRALFNRLPEARLHNHYGPSETHVVTAYTVGRDKSAWPTLPPIGRPIDNTQIYLLDAQLQVVPVGASGELYIGGDGLARGYLDRPDLTSERFVADPFNPGAGARLYRTGDLARYLPDGNLEFLGRADDQVKIRGFRVELAEIEAVLSQHPAVRGCAVSAHGSDGEKRLVAYLVSQPGQTLVSTALRDFLKARLADYMVPAHYLVLNELPLTPSGKVNRRALPEPAFSRADGGVGYVPPKSQLEQLIAGVWQAVLGLPQVGTRDNFFDLGGSSLMIVQVQRRLQDAVGRELSVTTLFQYPTIAALANHLNSSAEASAAQRLHVQDRAARQRQALARQRATLSVA